jgi:type I restriction enzyme S subunit
MIGEWITGRLGDYVFLQSGGTPSKSRSDYWQGDVPWVSAKDMKTYWIQDTEDQLSEMGADEAARIVEEGTTLLLVRGMTLHNDIPICRVRRSAAFNQDIKAVLARSGTDPEFVPYLLLGNKSRLLSVVDSAGHGTGRLNADTLLNLPVHVPPAVEQRRIAHILGTLDDQIQLNRRMNETLEALARATFKSWFVDFDPVRAKAEGRDPRLPKHIADLFPDRFEDSELGEIPAGWKVKPIGEAVRVVGGGTPSTKEPAFWEGGTHHWATPRDLSKLQDPVLLDTERKITDAGLAKISSGLLPVGTVLLSSRAPVGYLAVARVPVSVNQGFIAMVCEGPLTNHYVLHWALSNMEQIEGRASGTTFQEISKKNFRPMLALMPADDTLAAFEQQMSTIYDKITVNLK